jgi:transcriptional regulator with XRE-family HTH domain
MAETIRTTEERYILRNRIIGLLLRDAREKANKTKRECAEALGISHDAFNEYEEGKSAISLPELEVLAYVLGRPTDHFLRQDAALVVAEEPPPLQEILDLRHRIVGALLRQARLEAGKTQQDLADVIGRSSSRISDYEYGERPIPLVELEMMAQSLQTPIAFFLDGQKGPLGEFDHQQEITHRFQQLSPEIQEFVTQPLNIKYLEVAMKLAGMPVNKLRAIAEGLLDITY